MLGYFKIKKNIIEVRQFDRLKFEDSNERQRGDSRAQSPRVSLSSQWKKILCLTRRSRARQAVVFCFAIKPKEKILCLTGRSRARQAVVFRYQAKEKKTSV
jgi:hypothetical protein